MTRSKARLRAGLAVMMTIATVALAPPETLAQAPVEGEGQEGAPVGGDVGSALGAEGELGATEPEPSPVTVTPYGLLIFNSFYDTSPLSPSDIPLAALDGDQASLGMTLRQSRFGLKVESALVADAMGADAAAATLELDFLGGYYANNNITYTMSHPRLRLFFVKIGFGDVGVVVGQDWVIASPLNPTTLSHMALPGFQNAGNLWARLPQVRVDLKLGGLQLQAGVLAPVSSDSVGPGLTTARSASSSEQSSAPTLQARAAYSLDLDGKPLTVGVSGHFGMEKVALTMIDPMTMMPVPTGATEDATSYAAVLELSVPISILTLIGEAYVGQNIDGLFSSANVDSGTGDAIGAWGGWAQLLVTLDALTLGIGGGIEQITDGTEPSNVAIYADAIYAFAPAFKVGLELAHLRTDPGGAADVESGNQINLSAHFAF